MTRRQKRMGAQQARAAMTLGEQFAAARIARGWTIKELSQRAGVSVGVVHKCEHDENIQMHSRARILEALGARMESRLTLADPPEPSPADVLAARLSGIALTAPRLRALHALLDCWGEEDGPAAEIARPIDSPATFPA